MLPNLKNLDFSALLEHGQNPEGFNGDEEECACCEFPKAYCECEEEETA